MIVGDCPERGPMLIGYARLLALVNYEPGIIVVCWSCVCGEKHVAATGSIGSTDPNRAAPAVAAVRRRLAP